MLERVVALAFVVLPWASFVNAGLGKGTLYSSGFSSPLVALDSIWTPPSTYSNISAPQMCIDRGTAQGCAASNIIARRVTYQDCGDPWVLCACPSSGSISLDDLTARFARVPTGMRSYVGGVLAAPGFTPDAINTNNFITLKGTPPAALIFNSVAHSLDQGQSTGKDWIWAIGQDSCVADTFANNDYTEAFAQAQVVYAYINLHGNLGVDTTCMKKQLDHFLYNPPVREDMFTHACFQEKRPYYL